MWLSILSFLGGPVVKGLIDAYQAKLKAGNTSEKIASDTAAAEIAAETRDAELSNQYRLAIIGRWYEPVNLLAYIIVAYVAKVVVWDTMLDLGSTAAVRGNVGDWMGMVMLFLVGKRGFENVARILKR